MAITKKITEALKQLITDRYLSVLLAVTIILALIFVITTSLSIHPSERQLVSHYSAFGSTNIYSDQWFYFLTFVFFGLLVAIMHIIISIKILVVKGHSLAVMFAWFGIGIIIIGWITSFSILSLRTVF